MNKVQTAKLYMYNAVVSFCDSRPEAISSMGALVATYAQFKTTVTTIVDTVQLKTKIISGFAEGKNNRREALMEKAASIAGRLSSYAKNINDRVLQASVDYSLIQLKRLRDDELAHVCKIISAAAGPIINRLEPYNITLADLDSLNHDIQEFALWIPLSRNAISQRAGYVSKLRDLFKNADNTLRVHIDRQMQFFKKTDPGFYVSYRYNRQIIDYANVTAKITGVIVDAVTQKLLGAVKITILGTDICVIGEKFGGYTIKPVPPGTYDVQFEMEGYQTKVETGVIVKPGKTAKAFARMVPL